MFKTPLLIVAFISIIGILRSQPLINSWMVNTTGFDAYYWAMPGLLLTNLGEPANVQQVCWTTDSVWVEASGLGDTMGPYQNPGSPVNQTFTYRFPRNPQEELGTKTIAPNVFSMGALINGVPV